MQDVTTASEGETKAVVFDLGKDVRAKLFAVEIANMLQAAAHVQDGVLSDRCVCCVVHEWLYCT